MSVSRAGYYKWLRSRGVKSRYEQDREILVGLIKNIHERWKTYGYHRIAAVIRRDTGWMISDRMVHRTCQYIGIKSCLRKPRYPRQKPGEESVKFENIVRNGWNVDKPLKLIVSDMTVVKHKGIKHELTFFLDVYNNQIITYHHSEKVGDTLPYYKCLNDLMKILKTEEQTSPIVLHTDQGAVYSSRAYFEAHKKYNIIRSMSRIGTPTDNPVIEATNGWIKQEMLIDFGLNRSDNFKEFIDSYMHYYNNIRPAYALGYKTPVQFKTEQGF